jgi:hypothetical protein
LSALKGISIRRFAKLDGCDERLVRRAIENGHLTAFKDGSLDPKLARSGWRKRNRDRADKAKPAGKSAPDDADVAALAEKLVRSCEHMTKAEAERRKEVALASLRELELARELGSVVVIDDAVAERARDHLVTKNLLSSQGSRLAPTVMLLKSAEEVKAAIDADVANIFAALREDRDE